MSGLASVRQVGGESFVNHVEVSLVTSLIMMLTRPGPNSSESIALEHVKFLQENLKHEVENRS
jgi:hypothetical protein